MTLTDDRAATDSALAQERAATGTAPTFPPLPPLSAYYTPDPVASGTVRTATTPAELNAALAASVPGATVLIHGAIKGNFILTPGVFIKPSGSAGDAIVGSLTTAPECVLLDLEIYQTADQKPVKPDDGVNGVICAAQGCVMRRLHIHDVYGNGISIFGSRYGEFSESLVHNVSKQALYSHNDLEALNPDGTPKTIDVLRNVFWASTDGHVQYYSAGNPGNYVRNYRVIQNILVGLISTVGAVNKPTSNFLFQGNQVLKGALAKFGYHAGNHDVRVVDNVFSPTNVEYVDWQQVEHRGNVYHQTTVTSDYPLPLGSPFSSLIPGTTTIPLQGNFNLAWVIVGYSDGTPNAGASKPFDPNSLPLVTGTQYKLINVQDGTQKAKFTFSPGMAALNLTITTAPQVLALRTA